MFAKAVALLGLVAVAAGGAPAVTYLNPSVGVGGSNTVRGVAGLSSVTHQAKAVNSAFSTASAYKTKVTNDAVPVAYAQPALQYAHPAPVQYAAAAPAPVQYAQPALQYAHPAPVQYAQAAPVQYAAAAPAPVQYAQPAPVAYAQPAVQYAHAAPVQYAQAAPAIAYGHKTLSAAPVATPVAKVAAAVPAVAQPVAYAQPAAVAKVAAAPVAYAQPAVRLAGTKAVAAAPASLLGVAYSPVVPATASLFFNGLGASYKLF